MNQNPPDPWVLVGKIGKPVGLSGAIRVWSEAELDAIFENEAPLVLWDGVLEPSAPFLILELTREGRSWVARVEGQDNRSTVAELTNLMLVAKREDLPEPSPESVYWSDLVGAEVVTKAGEFLGRVRDLLDTPSSTVLEVETEEAEVFLVPLTAEVDADFEKEASSGGVGRVSIRLPEGMREATTVEKETRSQPPKRRLRPRRGRRP